MIVQCDQCQSKFRLDDSKITDKGAKVRCSKCSHIFTVTKEGPPPAEAPKPAEAEAEEKTEAAAPTPPPSPKEPPAPEPPKPPPPPVQPPEEEKEIPSEVEEEPTAEEDDEDISWDDLEGEVDESIFDDEESEGESEEDSGSYEIDEGDFDESVFDDDIPEEEAQGSAEASLEEGDFDASVFDEEPNEVPTGGDEENQKAPTIAFEDDEDIPGFGESEETAPSLDLGGGEEAAPSFDLGGGEEAAPSFDLGGGEEASGFGDVALDEGGEMGGGLDVEEMPAPSAPDSEGDMMSPPVPPSEMGEEGSISPEAAGEEGTAEKGAAEKGAAEKGAAEKGAAKGKKSPASLVLFLVLFLSLVGGGYYILSSGRNITIGSFDLQKTIQDITGLIGSEEASETGNIEIKDLNGYYLQTEKEGLAFIIEGKAFNNFPSLRSFIKVRGNLFDEKGAVVMSEEAYCGNVFSKDEAASFTRSKVAEEMAYKSGKGLMNNNIKAGKEIPFMIVFYNTPDNLAQFDVELVSSKNPLKN